MTIDEALLLLFPAEIVDGVYWGLSASLKKAAEWNVRCHLAKLRKDGRVEKDPSRSDAFRLTLAELAETPNSKV